ncbi:sensor histidine kinase [Thalassotalea ganghwensis]
MRDERKIIVLLSINVIVILTLLGLLSWSISSSWLIVSTLLFLSSYPLIWLAWKGYNFWQQTIRQLTSYTQMLKEGDVNIRFKPNHQNSLVGELLNEITALAKKKNTEIEQPISEVLHQIIHAWVVPVAVFDQSDSLVYRNKAMHEQLKQPMIIGSDIHTLGFSETEHEITHPSFNDDWQCQLVKLNWQQSQYRFVAAINNSHLINKKQSLTRRNLIRVLSHELRNSLTPMASMTETLLSCQTLDTEQTRQVLTRINQRSKRLLDFIQQYQQLAQLPKPHPDWFVFKEIVDDATSIVKEEAVSIQCLGEKHAYGDETQIAQVLINLIKNADEANIDVETKIRIILSIDNDQQTIEFIDNGPGFANLDNALTPFYTTKSHGSGIGLSLCAEIVQNHLGSFTINNLEQGGAKIIMTWPINSRRSSS